MNLLYEVLCRNHTGWNPELVFLTVVFFNSTDLAAVIPNSTVKRYMKTLPEIHFTLLF